MRRTPGGPTWSWGASADRTTSPGTRCAWTAEDITWAILAPCAAHPAGRRRRKRRCRRTGSASGRGRPGPSAARICARCAGSRTRLRAGCSGCAMLALRSGKTPGRWQAIMPGRMRTGAGAARCGLRQRLRRRGRAGSAARHAGKILRRILGTGCTARTHALLRRRCPALTRQRKRGTG